MQTQHYRIIAPAFDLPPRSEAEAFGSATWLWTHSKNHCVVPLLALEDLLLPAIARRQYVIVLKKTGKVTRPVGYMSWANLSADAESRYLHNSSLGLHGDDWNSGDRMWLIDCFAPFGDVAAVIRLCKPLFARVSARYINHHSNERGLTVRTVTGGKVDRTYAKQWWSERPMLAAKRPELPRRLQQLQRLHSRYPALIVAGQHAAHRALVRI